MSNPHPPPGDFPQTRWTLVQRAVAEGDANAFAALSSLCETYYRPLLAVIRSQGYSPEDGDDLRQRFFIHLVNREKFSKALTTGVKLRAFLLQELKGFLIDHYRHSIAAKRDHRKNNYLDDPDHHESESAGLVNWSTPDLEYDRTWRIALVKHCMRAVGEQWEEKRLAGKNLPPFKEIGPLLSYKSEETQRAVADRLGINENTLKTHLSALRAEFGKQVHFQVAQTLVNPTQEAILAEISALQLMK
jgi:DNA-directed RNA polymerase specialized sigma24 family protein